MGKIKCAAKALACMSACSSFNFAKGWHFFFHFSARLLSVVSSFRVSANGFRLGDVADYLHKSFLELLLLNLA
ncbi:MAG: hypothetical protein KDE33_02815, partial [Bacteroidetes bacterium]|nr:hypothetical protein [Bacteroidota bacterium]